MTLELYHRWACPYSAKVRDFVKDNELSMIRFHDTDSEDGAEQKLMELTGDNQVPCLVVDGKPMLESDDIIEWLDENVVSGREAAA